MHEELSQMVTALEILRTTALEGDRLAWVFPGMRVEGGERYVQGFVCLLWHDLQIGNTKSSFSSQANMLLFKLTGSTIKHELFRGTPGELKSITDLLSPACSLFFLAAIFLEYNICFCIICNKKTEDQLSWFDWEMNSWFGVHNFKTTLFLTRTGCWNMKSRNYYLKVKYLLLCLAIYKLLRYHLN